MRGIQLVVKYLNAVKISFFILFLVFASECFSEVILSVEDAQKKLFPSSNQFQVVAITLDKSELKKIKKLSKVRVFPERMSVWKVFQDHGERGWFITDKVIGKHELITYALAIDVQGNILGLEIIEYLETHGGEVREDQWRKQFLGKSISNASLKLGKDIDGLSGATLSARNITDGVRKLLMLVESLKSQTVNTTNEMSK